MDMITRTRKSIVQGTLLALIFIFGLSGISSGAEFWLRAETLTKTMPDANVITMWGFAQCTNGTYASCGPATVPGPRLTVPTGDTVLTINLRNNLTGLMVEPVSLVIPGLLPATAMTPVKFTDSEGRQRVKSFTPETPADNATTITYSWTMKPGTYLYESGSHPAVQIQMGLYGAVTRNAAAGQAYGPSTAYNTEALLLFSEIDPLLHGHVAAGTYGTPPPTGITSTVDYEPKYFLINGEPFTPAAIHIPSGTAGQSLLLRFLSAGLKHRVPTIYGMNLSLVAEDGNLYPYPKAQYSLLLSPGKTMDALVTPDRGGEYPVYDRRLGLTNNATPSGGMLSYLSVVPLPDVTPPTGSVVINGGALTTNSLNVTLTLSATDLANAVADMRFSWDNTTWLGWAAYAATANITIPAGPDGIKTIYVQFRDAAGNVSLTYSDSIQLVTSLFTGSVVINGGAVATSSRSVTLTLSAASNAGAVTSRRVSWNNGTTWSGWTTYTATVGATVPNGDGIKTVSVQYRDAVGNISPTYTDTIILDRVRPTGSVVINGGAATTASTSVTLTFSATDAATSVTDMRWRWSNAAWGPWVAYAATANATITGGFGNKTVQVQYRDAAGNASSTYNDAISYQP